MPVMMAMAVVVSQHAAIVGGANPGIDVRQAVFHHRAAIAPNLFFHDSTTSAATEIAGLIDSLARFRGPASFLSAHDVTMIAQMGCRISLLFNEGGMGHRRKDWGLLGVSLDRSPSGMGTPIR